MIANYWKPILQGGWKEGQPRSCQSQCHQNKLSKKRLYDKSRRKNEFLKAESINQNI